MRQLPAILLATTLLLAGCLSGEDPATSDGNTDDDGQVTYTRNGTSPVEIAAFELTNDRDDPNFYEDDRIHLRVTVRHDGTGNGTAQHYLTLRADGDILLIESVILEPGARETFTRTLVPNRTGAYPVSATIAGGTAETTLDLQERTRPGEWTGFHPASLRLNYAHVDDFGVTVNLTLHNTQADANLTEAEARLVCRTPDGQNHAKAARSISTPEAGNMTSTTLRFSACHGPDQPHGIHVHARGEDGSLVRDLILLTED